jgi:hypothetical protein
VDGAAVLVPGGAGGRPGALTAPARLSGGTGGPPRGPCRGRSSTC